MASHLSYSTLFSCAIQACLAAAAISEKKIEHLTSTVVFCKIFLSIPFEMENASFVELLWCHLGPHLSSNTLKNMALVKFDEKTWVTQICKNWATLPISRRCYLQHFSRWRFSSFDFCKKFLHFLQSDPIKKLRVGLDDKWLIVNLMCQISPMKLWFVFLWYVCTLLESAAALISAVLRRACRLRSKNFLTLSSHSLEFEKSLLL